MRISTLFYTLRQGVRNIFRNKLFSLASIATITACLFMFGVFYSIVVNVEHMVHAAEEGVCVTVFFQDGTEETKMQEIGKDIEGRVEVAKVEFVSADEAWDSFKTEYLGEYADGFTENPLEGSANFRIYLSDVSMQSALVTYLQSIPEVRKVNQSEMTADALTGVNSLLGYISIGIIGILFFVSVFLIRNTVTIGIHVRKEEINIMKYIGATDFFVRAPFVVECVLIGLVGAAIPLGIVYFLYNELVAYVMSDYSILTSLLVFLPVEEVFRVLVPLSLGIGGGIGFFGSVITVRKHLRV